MAEISIAVITEGVSEYGVIEYILTHYMEDEPFVTRLQPKIVNGKQVGPGGWNEVLKYCSNEDNIKEALLRNDYLLIQIDTDRCDIDPYSVPKLENGRTLSEEELWPCIADRIYEGLPQDVDRKRVILAISNEMIECWFLPIFCTNDAQKGKNTGCIETLNRELRRSGIHIITDKNSNQAKNTYSSILKLIKKRKSMEECAKFHYGFKVLLEKLKEIDAEH